MKKLTCFVISLITCLMASFVLTGCTDEFTVTLDANGGVVSTTSVPVVIDEEYILPTPDARVGYQFLGWFDGETKYETTGTWAKEEDVTLTAKWQANVYNVTLDANGGVVENATLSVTYGQAFTLPTPTRKGHSFEGWELNGQTFESGVWNLDQRGVKLVAKWKVDYCTVKYDCDGGTIVYGNEQESAYVGQEYVFAKAQKPHKVFKGWQVVGGTTIYTEQSIPNWTLTGEIKLKALWEDDKHTVTIDLAGGEGYTGETTIVNVPCNTKITVQNTNITKVGYTFNGWVASNGDVVAKTETEYLVKENVTLKVAWIANDVTVKFVVGEGQTVEPTQMVIKFGSEYTLPTPVRNGYDFDGWRRKGGNKQDISTSGIWNQPDAEIELEPKWKGAACTVTFDYTGCDDENPETTKTYYVEQFVTLPVPTKEGHDFKGWKVKGTQTVLPLTEIVWVNSGTLELEATWEIAEYTITFDVKGATFDKTTLTIKYNEAYDWSSFAPAFEHKQLIFKGWKIADTTLAVSGNWGATGDVTVVAIWQDENDDSLYGPNA